MNQQDILLVAVALVVRTYLVLPGELVVEVREHLDHPEHLEPLAQQILVEVLVVLVAQQALTVVLVLLFLDTSHKYLKKL
jgi:hypothetical protein